MVPCFFVEAFQKRNSTLSLNTLPIKNITRDLVIVCFLLNMIFLLFSGSLTWKYINNSYLVPVYIVSKPNATFKTVTFIFNAFLSPSKCQSYLSFYFDTSKDVTRYLPFSLCACNYVISAGFLILPWNYISSSRLVVFWPRKILFELSFELSGYKWPFQLLVLRFSKAKYIHYIFVVCWRSPKRHFCLSESSLRSGKITGTFVVVCLSLNIIYPAFPAILT